MIPLIVTSYFAYADSRRRIETMSLARLESINLLKTAEIQRVGKYNLSLHKNIDQSVPFINGSAEQLTQLVSHLIVNAIKYSQQGTITISVKNHDADKTVCLEVQDEGIGIPPSEQKHIFERFYRGQEIGQSNIPGIV